MCFKSGSEFISPSGYWIVIRVHVYHRYRYLFKKFTKSNFKRLQKIYFNICFRDCIYFIINGNGISPLHMDPDPYHYYKLDAHWNPSEDKLNKYFLVHWFSALDALPRILYVAGLQATFRASRWSSVLDTPYTSAPQPAN